MRSIYGAEVNAVTNVFWKPYPNLRMIILLKNKILIPRVDIHTSIHASIGNTSQKRIGNLNMLLNRQANNSTAQSGSKQRIIAILQSLISKRHHMNCLLLNTDRKFCALYVGQYWNQGVNTLLHCDKYIYIIDERIHKGWRMKGK